jgi:hypothetical protein
MILCSFGHGFGFDSVRGGVLAEVSERNKKSELFGSLFLRVLIAAGICFSGLCGC